MSVLPKKGRKIDPEILHEAINRQVPSEFIRTADDFGYEIFAVGGCIRNYLLGREIDDVDISVVGDAVRLARRIARDLNAGDITVYARFGTALVTYMGRNYEFATSRSESYLPDSRKPAEVVPVPIDLDLQRRDFTINALALALTGPQTGRLLDLFDGMSDLRRRVLRTPLDPDATFSDDPLRILRGIRFAAEYGLKFMPETWKGIISNLGRLEIVAPERIGEEVFKMLKGVDPARAMTLMIDSGIMSLLMPEVLAMSGVEQVGRHHHKDVLRHSLRVMQNVVENSDDPVVRMAGLLHDIGKPGTKKFITGQGWSFHGHELTGARIAGRIGRRLKLGKDNVNRLTKLVRLHMRPINLTSEGVTDSAIRRLMFEAGDELDDQLKLCRADITTANPKLVGKYLENFDEMAKRMGDVEARDKMRRFQSPIRGDEIMSICDVPPGPYIGALKGRIEDAILDGIIPYEYEAAKEYLLSIKDGVLSMDIEKLRREIRERSRDRSLIDRKFNFPSDETGD